MKKHLISPLPPSVKDSKEGEEWYDDRRMIKRKGVIIGIAGDKIECQNIVAAHNASLASLGARLKKEPIAFQAETQMPRGQQPEGIKGDTKSAFIDLLNAFKVAREHNKFGWLEDAAIKDAERFIQGQ